MEVDKKSSIYVAVRVRPFNKREKLLQEVGVKDNQSNRNKIPRKIIQIIDDNLLYFDPPQDTVYLNFMGIRTNNNTFANCNKRPKNTKFAFDRVFQEDVTQDEVFEFTTKDLVQNVLDGFNSTVFAYGATGCGKTHTITGTKEGPGIIFMTIELLFDKIKNNTNVNTKLCLTYLEIYNEVIRDLLSPIKKHSRTLRISNDSKKGIHVTGLSEYYPETMDEVMRLILLGNNNRSTSATEANSASSRSHSILQIKVYQSSEDTESRPTSAVLSIIDLAGSERACVSNNKGQRRTEALCRCINALGQKSSKKAHIPYRDSQLTHLLQPSLGGNCKTVMIVCISPSSIHHEESYNTLCYADRAKNIVTKAIKNNVSVDMRLKEYSKLLEKLKLDNIDVKKQLKSIDSDYIESCYLLDMKSHLDKFYSGFNSEREKINAINYKKFCHNSELSKNRSNLEHAYYQLDLLNNWFTNNKNNQVISNSIFDVKHLISTAKCNIQNLTSNNVECGSMPALDIMYQEMILKLDQKITEITHRNYRYKKQDKNYQNYFSLYEPIMMKSLSVSLDSVLVIDEIYHLHSYRDLLLDLFQDVKEEYESNDLHNQIQYTPKNKRIVDYIDNDWNLDSPLVKKFRDYLNGSDK